MASTYELIVKAVDQTSAPMNKIDKALKGANTRTTKLNATLKKTNNGLKTFGKAGVKGLGSLTKGLGVAAAAATAAAGAFAFMAKQSINTLDNLGKTASKLGVTTEFLSRYRVIAERAGISTETFDMALQRFQRRLGEAQMGTGELLKPLKAMGISMKDANGNFKDGTVVFEEFIAKLGETENAERRLALAMKGFDSEGVKMVNIAEMGADKIALIGRRASEAGLVISSKLTKAAADANDAMGELFDFGKGFKLQFFGALSETIQELSEMLREKILLKIEASGGMGAFANNIAASFLEGTSKFITASAQFVDDFTNAFATFTNIFKGILVQLSKIVPGFSATFSGDLTIAEDLEKAKQKLKELIAEKDKMSLGDRLIDSMPTTSLAIEDQAIAIQIRAARTAVEELEQSLADLESGKLVVFEKMSTTSTKAADAVGGVTTELEENAAGLRKNAAVQAEYNRTSNLITSDAGFFNAELEKNNNTVKEGEKTFKKALLPLNQFDQYMRDLTNSASAAATKIIHEQQAVAELDRLLAAGKISIDTYAQSMVMLGKGAGGAKDEIAKMAPHVSQFDQYMRDLVESSNAAVTQQGFEIMALAELDRMLQANKISLDAYVAAKESIRPYDFSKDAPPQMFDEGLTPQQNLDILTQQMQKEAELLQMKKDILALAGPEQEAAIQEALGLENKLNFQEQLVESYKKNHEELDKVTTALANVSQLALDAGVSEEFLTETLLAQQDALEKNLGTWTEKALTTSEIIKNGFNSMANSIGGELATAIRKGEGFMDALSNAFTRTLDNILQQILTSQINSLLAQMFNIGPSAGKSGGGLGSLITSFLGTPTVGAPWGGLNFGGMRATGGPVARGQSYLVGENSPEIFQPTTAGSITPMDEVNNSNKQVVFNINAVDTQTGIEFLLKNKPQIINMVSQGFNQRGRQGITS
jgi:hypothetical protein